MAKVEGAFIGACRGARFKFDDQQIGDCKNHDRDHRHQQHIALHDGKVPLEDGRQAELRDAPQEKINSSTDAAPNSAVSSVAP